MNSPQKIKTNPSLPKEKFTNSPAFINSANIDQEIYTTSPVKGGKKFFPDSQQKLYNIMEDNNSNISMPRTNNNSGVYRNEVSSPNNNFNRTYRSHQSGSGWKANSSTKFKSTYRPINVSSSGNLNYTTMTEANTKFNKYYDKVNSHLNEQNDEEDQCINRRILFPSSNDSIKEHRKEAYNTFRQSYKARHNSNLYTPYDNEIKDERFDTEDNRRYLKSPKEIYDNTIAYGKPSNVYANDHFSISETDYGDNSNRKTFQKFNRSQSHSQKDDTIDLYSCENCKEIYRLIIENNRELKPMKCIQCGNIMNEKSYQFYCRLFGGKKKKRTIHDGRMNTEWKKWNDMRTQRNKEKVQYDIITGKRK